MVLGRSSARDCDQRWASSRGRSLRDVSEMTSRVHAVRSHLLANSTVVQSSLPARPARPAPPATNMSDPTQEVDDGDLVDVGSRLSALESRLTYHVSTTGITRNARSRRRK